MTLCMEGFEPYFRTTSEAVSFFNFLLPPRLPMSY